MHEIIDPDGELVSRWQSGDEGAFEALVRRHEQRVFRLLYRMMGNREEAEDVAQEAFLSLHRHGHRFRREARFSTFVYRVAANAALNRRRALGRNRNRMNELKVSQQAGFDLPSGPRDPEDAATGSEAQQRVQSALLELPEDLRVAILLYDIEGQSYQDEITHPPSAQRAARSASELRRPEHRRKYKVSYRSGESQVHVVDTHVVDRLGDHLEGDLNPEEFKRVDAHLAACSACAVELRELRETIALLRGLPDPVPPPRMAADVMQRIEDQAGSGGRVIELFREVAQPRVVAALAAGIAALAVFFTLDIGEGGLLGPSSDPDRGLIESRDVLAGDPDAGAETASRSRPLSPVPVAPESYPRRNRAILVALQPRVMPPQRAMTVSAAPRYGIFSSAAPEVPLRDLETEFEALMADPQAFLDRVERTRVSARRPMIAPLVEHSARRGGVSEMNRFLGRAAAPMAVPVSTAR